MRTFIAGALVALCLIAQATSAQSLTATRYRLIASSYVGECSSPILTGGAELNHWTGCSCPPRVPVRPERTSFAELGPTAPITMPDKCSPIVDSAPN
jgi:hypothetical protein